ncbi:MAG: hypothetical protein B7X38_02400 [Stenotrophomonas sp. 14-69-23]|jgi:hypothetical protein|nr:MAG: hypothetical protein B7X38_02400 [Stenotrophomonas sp. 14-69-23]
MRPNQDFTMQNLMWMRGKRPISSVRHYPADGAAWRAKCSEIEEQIATETFAFTGIFSSTARGKQVLGTNDLGTILVLRKINDNIRRAYGLRQVQRSSCVSLLKKALSEHPPKGLIRTDLKSCFETIRPAHVLQRLQNDGKVSYQTIDLLRRFLEATTRFGSNKYKSGLPRGILISSTLAEVFLSDLDRSIALLEGIYIYVRYVDDIVALCSRDAAAVFEEMARRSHALGLELNTDKSKHVNVGCKCSFSCRHPPGRCPCNPPNCQCTVSTNNLESIDFLGYKFIFKTGKDLKKKPSCHLLLSDNKIKKYKSRICSSLQAYKTDRNHSLLHDRIKLLTSSQTLHRTSSKTKLRTGLGHTYSSYSPPDSPHQFQANSLEDLDTFLRTKVRILAKKLRMTYMQRRLLLRHSFKSGHTQFHRSNFDAARLEEIRKCWKEKEEKD